MHQLEKAKPAFELIIAHIKQEIGTLRTGRANPVIVEDIAIEAYGARQPLKNLATINTPDSRTILIAPWDKSVLSAIEKGILLANIGLNPSNDGNVIRLSIPPLTEETRKDLVKNLKQRLEAGRIQIRQQRDEIKTAITTAEKDGEIGEDEKFHDIEKLDELVKQYNEKIEKMGEEKESEIMKI